MDVTIYTDGAARGNPGSAGAGWVIVNSAGDELESSSLSLGVATNNVAEYRAVIEALKRASELQARRVHVRSDSQLLVNQLNGSYQVRNEGLIPLYRQVLELSGRFEQVTFEYIPREQNRRADELASAAAAGDGAQQPVPAAAGEDKKLTPPGDSAGDRNYELRLRVRYGETDQMGVAYYANYLDWFTEARTALMRQGGVSYKEMEERHIYLPVREVHCQYIQPVRYDDELLILTRVTQLTPVRFDFEYTIYKNGSDKPCAAGWTKHAFMDESGRPFNLRKRHPDIWERLQKAVS